ncbi:DUF5009 domain-containing protein [Adhaeretor mobilis]|uniref:DUF5009 domain-containing protein n=1 Tax=Adhaeretor mobilis TaxID=1930276 RepID=A0A517MPW4_9BACT|nr:DUF5009 domain-containing protein [Adhaeretor mobilis]QDS96914.1 hypothetical protein HG15A2_01730 [Adhaeretor mobilis]
MSSSPRVDNQPIATTPERILSVDVLRALIILLMVFVNDVWTAPGVPDAFLHAEKSQDAMTLADWVYPAFLFIVGVSIPLAFQASAQRGISFGQQWLHIAIRTVSLLVMGLFMVNMTHEATGWPESLWSLLFLLAFVATWVSVPRVDDDDAGQKKKRIYWAVKICGALALVVLALCYRDATGQGLQHRWWGILGQIGWAYFFSCLIYQCFGPRREWLLAGAAVCMASYYGDQVGLFSKVADKPWLEPISPLVESAQWLSAQIHAFVVWHGSLYALTMAGAALGTTMLSTTMPTETATSPVGLPPGLPRLRWAASLCFFAAMAALALDGTFGINKIRSTPSWVLWSMAFTTATWMLLYASIDLAGWVAPARWLQPVGANPLLAYFLQPILIHVMEVVRFEGYQRLGEISPAMGVLRSTLMVATVAALTGLLARNGVRVRL